MTTGKEEADLLNLLQEWGDAYVRRDLATLDRVRADDWTYSGDLSGKVTTKAEADEAFQRDPTEFLAFRFDDVRTRIAGDMALVHCLEEIDMRKDGNVISGRFRLTVAFVRHGGRWRAVLSHNSPVQGG